MTPASASIARSPAFRCACPWWTSIRWARAAARSPGSTATVCSKSARSAPAPIPGPACYGQGGDQPTVTDANLRARTLVAGRLARRARCRSTPSLARKAFTPIAEQLGFTAERTAHGALGILVANMVRAIRTISVEKGHDPRDYTLMAFGGAGAAARRRGRAQSGHSARSSCPTRRGSCAPRGSSSPISRRTSSIQRGSPSTTNSPQRSRRAMFEDLNGRARRLVRTRRRSRPWRTRGSRWRSTCAMSARISSCSPCIQLDSTPTDRRPGFRHPRRTGCVARAVLRRARVMQYGFHNPHDPIEIVNLTGLPPAARCIATQPVRARADDV